MSLFTEEPATLRWAHIHVAPVVGAIRYIRRQSRAIEIKSMCPTAIEYLAEVVDPRLVGRMP